MKKPFSLIVIFLLSFSMFAVFAPKANASNSLVGYWKFDEGSGSTAHDSAGTNDGVIRGVPSWTTGIVGGALRFDGAQNDYVAMSSQLDLTDAMTVEVWVYPTFDPTNPAAYPQPLGDAGRTIIRKSSCGDDTFELGFYSGYYFNHANPVPYISAVFLYQGGGSANLEPVSIPGLISEGQWYHLVITFQRNDYARLYVNGVEEMALTTDDKPLRVSSRHLTIGQEADIVGGDPLDTPSDPQTWIGKIDEVKIYNYARTAEEILTDYTSTPPATATLNVNVFDEGGFSPASVNGAVRLADIPVEIYSPDGTLIGSGLTDSTGSVSFNLPVGTYNVTYGGTTITPYDSGIWWAVSSKIVDVQNNPTNTDVYAIRIIFHHYSGGNNFELNYIDLNTTTANHENSITVAPGQQINAEFSWSELETANVPVWYVSVFGSWNPTSTLGNLANGVASPSSDNLHTVPLTFTAPTTPGTYEVRLNGVEDYDWPNSYYTSFHYQPTLGRDTCNDLISKSNTGPYGIGIITVTVMPPPPVKYAIIFYTDPSNIGSITFAGTQYTNGQSGQYAAGSYSVVANAPLGWSLDHWVTTGVSISSTATVTGDGIVTVVFKKALQPQSVGGEWSPITMHILTPANTRQMLPLWISLVSLMTLLTTSFVYIRRKRPQN